MGEPRTAGWGERGRCGCALAVILACASSATAQTVLHAGGEWDFESGFVWSPHMLAGQCAAPPGGGHQSCVPGGAQAHVGTGWHHWASFPSWSTPGYWGYPAFNENKNLANVTSGTRSQEITLTCANGVGIVWRTATVPTDHIIRVEADARYTYGFVPGFPPIEVSMGLDPTGGTDPLAASVQWRPWDATAPNVFNHTVEEIASTGPTLTVFIRMLHREPTCEGGTFMLDNVRVLDLGPAVPMIGVTPLAVHATTYHGVNAAPTSFVVRNSGSHTLTYTISESLDWMTVDPASGSSTGEDDTIAVTFDAAGLPQGTYSGAITITAPGAGNSPLALPVTLVVRNLPGDFDGDDDVDQTDFGAFQRCLSGDGIAQDLPVCADARLDGDADVDAADFALFLGCMTGPNVPATHTCLP